MSTYNASLTVIPSDDYNLPQPGLLKAGAATAGSNTTTLVDSAAEFTNAETNTLGYNIRGGDIIYNITQGVSYQVVKVVNDTSITITTAGVAIAATDVYQIYKGNVAGSEGYSLYFGTTGDVKVTDASGNITTINNVPAGKIIDLQVVKVFASVPTPPIDIILLDKQD